MSDTHLLQGVGHVIKNKAMKKQTENVNVKMERWMVDKLRALAKESDRSVAAMVRHLLAQALS